ncbi:MAG: phosphotransferase family protein [Acidimicrobiales bacterium]
MSTAEVRELVDVARLAAYVRSVAPVAGEIEVEVLSGGQSNLTYLVSSGPHEYVARRRPLGTVPSGAHDMEREYRVLAAIADSGLPVPRVYGYSDDEAVLGAPFYLMDRVHGSVFHARRDVEGLTESQGRDISIASIDVLADLHRIDYTAVGLDDLGRPDGFVRRRIGRWLDQWERNPHRDHPLVEPLGATLLDRAPAKGDSTLVHGDFRLGNMIIRTEAPVRVAAILDWEMSTLGDPLTDLAHLLVYWEPSRGRLTHESQEIASHPGFLAATELADRYARSTGRDLSGLDVYLAFEHWRAAIIKEGIYMRRQATGRPDPGTEALGSSVDQHLGEAGDLLG